MSKVDSSVRYDIFLAHASADIGFATRLYRLLTPRCRVFLASQSLLAGDSWNTEIALALRDSLVTVVLISSNTESSFYQQEEIAAAIAFSREDPVAHRVVPLYLNGDVSLEGVPFGLRQLHSITRNRGLKEVSEKIHDLINELQARHGPVGDVATTEVAHPGDREIDDTAAIREAGLIDILQQALLKSGNSVSMTLALIDIDNQTAINRRFGVAAGDQTIASLYEMLGVLVDGRTFGRFGDDSFYVVFANAEIKEVRGKMERFRLEVQTYDWKHVASHLYVTCSIGIAGRMGGEDARKWASRAGEGVRFAKAAGGNRIDVGPQFLSEGSHFGFS